MNTRQLLLTAWNFDWFGIALVVAMPVAYVLYFGWPGPGKARHLVAATLILFLTLLSPVGTLADDYLFSAHMLQHLLLLLIVPALLVMAMPTRHSSASSAAPSNRLSGLRLGAGWLAGVAAMWVWHAPSLCNAATTSDSVHRIQVLSLLLLGSLFWWPILGPRTDHRLPPLTGIVYLFTACLACTLLGIYITFAPVSVCSVYVQPTDRLNILPLLRREWRLTPSVDQQIGGLMMWVPACMIYLTGIIGLLGRWFSTDEEERESKGPLGAGPQDSLPQPRPT